MQLSNHLTDKRFWHDLKKENEYKQKIARLNKLIKKANKR